MTVRASNGELSGQFKAFIVVVIGVLLSVSGFLATAAYSDIKEDVSGLQSDVSGLQVDVSYIRATLDQWEPAPSGGN